MCSKEVHIEYAKTGKEDGIGTHQIVGKSNVKYTVIDGNSLEIDNILHDAIHVSILNVCVLLVQYCS